MHNSICEQTYQPFAKILLPQLTSHHHFSTHPALISSYFNRGAVALCGAVRLNFTYVIYCLAIVLWKLIDRYLLIEAYLYPFGFKSFKTYNSINSFNTIKYLFIWGELWFVGTWCKSICGWSEVLSVIIPFISFKTPCGGTKSLSILLV